MDLYKKNPDIIEAVLEDDICLFDPAKAQYLNLNPTASFIWSNLGDPIDIEKMVDKLINKYNVNRGICYTQTKEFVKRLTNLDLIILK